MKSIALPEQSSFLKNYKEFFKFALVGVLNTAIDIGIYTLLTRSAYFFHRHLLFAKAISFVCATISSFIFNRSWTFERQGKIMMAEIIRFYSTVGSAIFINLGVVYIVHTRLHINDLIAVVAATLTTIMWNYLFSKFWVFKNNS